MTRIKNLAANPNRLFLIDALGALLNAVLLLLILLFFQSALGMPEKAMTLQLCFAVACTVYSWCCRIFEVARWRTFLTIVIFLNAAYACLTAILIVTFAESLTTFGFVYFSLEFLTLAVLIMLETAVLLEGTRHVNQVLK